jgi:hypothetical protein
MSAKFCGAVWEMDLPATDKFVLLAFADHADPQGQNIRLSIARIVARTGLSESTVDRAIRSLKSAGILIAEANETGGRGKITVYSIDTTKGVTLNPFIPTETGSQRTPLNAERGSERGSFGTAKGVHSSRAPGKALSGEPLGEPLEPIINVHSAPTQNKKSEARFVKPEARAVADYIRSLGGTGEEARAYFDHYTANGWKVGRNPMKDWQAAARNWHSGRFVGGNGHRNGTNGHKPPARDQAVNQLPDDKYAYARRLEAARKLATEQTT